MKRALLAVLSAVTLLLSAGCAERESSSAAGAGLTGSMEIKYAKNYSIDCYAGGAMLLTIGDGARTLLLPEQASVPDGLEALPQIKIPVENIYLASSSAADLFLQAGGLGSVRFTSTNAANWRLPEMKSALEEERILYAGKYSAPDYELLLTEGCGLVLENTMILHSPAVKEKLEELGMPVLVEYSSYEPHPLGRVEWIRLYGILSGHQKEAEAFFAGQCEIFRSIENAQPTGKTVAFFHITPNGGVVVRKKADYLTRMIEMAGAESAVADLPEEENALSSVTIQMENFYAQARDADILIYNSTVSGDVSSMEDFLSLSPLLKDFKAVREGNVWCTEMDMFQRSSAAAEMIADIRGLLTGENDSLRYLHRVA